jgi:serine/threonine-protein kinase
VILYEMFIGHVPFTGESATAIMLKHLQEPPPSVLDERKDLPEAVGQVVAQALSKLPEERQASAGALAEALASAAMDELRETATGAAGATSEYAQPGEVNTNRIVVPTAGFESRNTTSLEEDADDATVVHARQSAPVMTARTPIVDEPEIFELPPPAASFNPWRIMIPAAVVLIALLGVFYAYQRNSDSTPTNDNSQPLAADPNALPVQPGATPTGADESNIIPATGVPTPSTAATTETSTGGGRTNVNSNPITETTPLPTPSSEDTQNSNTSPEEDETDPTPSPTPTPTPRRNPTPPPTRSPTPDDPPPPTPTPPSTLATPPVLPPSVNSGS